jgi:hypothetical protein
LLVQAFELHDFALGDVAGQWLQHTVKEMTVAICILLLKFAPPWSAQEIEAIRPVYEEAETEYWAMKKESLRAIYRGMQRGKYDQ